MNLKINYYVPFTKKKILIKWTSIFLCYVGWLIEKICSFNKWSIHHWEMAKQSHFNPLRSKHCNCNLIAPIWNANITLLTQMYSSTLMKINKLIRVYRLVLIESVRIALYSCWWDWLIATEITYSMNKTWWVRFSCTVTFSLLASKIACL